MRSRFLLRIARHRWPPALALACLAGPPILVPGSLEAQTSWPEPACVQFDSAYFGWDLSWTGQSRATTTSILWLLAEPNPLTQEVPQSDEPKRLQFGVGFMEGSLVDRVERVSYWRWLAPDSVEILWSSGLVGRFFQFGVQQDSLVGSGFYFSDTGPFEQELRPETALMIPCSRVPQGADRGRRHLMGSH